MEQREDAWVGIYWRPAAAVVYLTICLFDFVVVPVWLGFHGNKLADVIPLVQTLAPEAQMAVMQQAMQWWQPLTLAGGGLFHLAFGAILGAAAWSRRQERIEALKTSSDPNSPTL